MNLRIVSTAAVALLLGGCATTPLPPPAPLSAAAGAAALSARSLDDPGLRRFLRDNLGREPAGPWDFEALAWTAFYFHPSLEVARAQWATARAAQTTAGTRPNPTISLVPGYNFTREPGLSPWFPAVNLDFLLGSEKRTRQQAVARAESEAARLSVVTAAWQVRADLRKALLDLGTATARLTNLQEQANAQQQFSTRLEQRFALGRATASEVSVAHIAHLRAESALADAHGQILSARARLAAALAVPASALDRIELAPLPNSPALSPEALATARRESLQSRADVLLALARYESAQASLALEVAKQHPDLHLGPGYQWDQGANKWSLALSFELPLFHRNEAVIAETVARRAEVAAHFNTAQAQVIAALDSAVAAQSAATTQLETARRLADEFSAQAARAHQRLNLGAADDTERLTAQLELATARLAVTDATSAAALAAGQLEDALQIPFRNLAALTP